MPGGPLNLNSTNLPRPWSPQESSPSEKIPTAEPGIEPGTSWSCKGRSMDRGSVRSYKVPWNGRIKHTLTHYFIICPSQQKSGNADASLFLTAQNIGPLTDQMAVYPVRYVVSKNRLNFSTKEL